ncbi:MAG: heme-dependent oxidative N-demethylase subunit alpha family protein [Bdellovibrionota bacterium]
MSDLAAPAVYVPLDRPVYEVAPGLKPLGFNFGNGEADARVLQIDQDFLRYRDEKERARADALTKYVGFDRLEPEVLRGAVDKILELMSTNHPEVFSLETSGSVRRLHCRLTGETLEIDPAGQLVGHSGVAPVPPYLNAYDALMHQLQEDGAIVSVREGHDRLSGLHVCLPSHWDPRSKLGRDFTAVHLPVPGADRMSRAHKGIVEAMVYKGPFVRFVWSFVTDKRLNHHPEPPRGEDVATWKGRSFDDSDPTRSPFHLRVERQTIVGLPGPAASLFFIRISFVDGKTIRENPVWRANLVGALKSMSPESRVYKGVEPCFDRLIGWLEAP